MQRTTSIHHQQKKSIWGWLWINYRDSHPKETQSSTPPTRCLKTGHTKTQRAPLYCFSDNCLKSRLIHLRWPQKGYLTCLAPYLLICKMEIIRKVTGLRIKYNIQKIHTLIWSKLVMYFKMWSLLYVNYTLLKL